MARPPEPPFWLVWCENGGTPTVRHESPDAAEREARRLAAAHPGKSFLVLAPVARCTKQDIVVERFDHDAYVPF